MYGLRYIDVWESETDWERFRVEQVEPAVGKVLGIVPDASLAPTQPLDVVDVWLGS